MATREQLIEAQKKALLSPNNGKHGKRKMTLLKEEALEAVKKRFIDELEEFLPNSDLFKIHKELLHKREVVKVFDHNSGEYEKVAIDQPETQAASRGLDMAYRIKGMIQNAPETQVNIALKIDV